jgi:hypothetical protein
MRSLVYDELITDEISNIKQYLDNYLLPSTISGLYWMILPFDILSNTQKELQDTAGPFKIAVDLRSDSVRFELLVRGDEVTNKGSAHADEVQASHVHAFASKMARDLNLIACL